MFVGSWPAALPVVVGALFVALAPGEAAAGPYFRLNPYPASVMGGISLDSTKTGAVFGGTALVDYRLAHVNERYTISAGARLHAGTGPLSSNFGTNHHLAVLAAARFGIQVDANQPWYPYVVLGAGFLDYAGHPRSDGTEPTGRGVGFESTVGVLYQLNDRLGWFVEGGLMAGTPHAVYARVSGGVGFSFGPTGREEAPY